MIQGSSNSRTAIFASIRENLAKSKPFDKDHCEQDRVSEAPLGVAAHDLLEVFRESVEQVGAKCTFVENENEAANRVRGIINDLSATEIIVSDSELVHRVVNMAQIDAIGNASRDELFSSDVGITSAQWAIAETGTLVLESRAERHRLLSLVPPVHVCIVKSISIRQSMAEILDLLDTDADPSVTFITGASRTSDIELTLVIGVHGPGELHVIVIKDR